MTIMSVVFNLLRTQAEEGTDQLSIRAVHGAVMRSAAMGEFARGQMGSTTAARPPPPELDRPYIIRVPSGTMLYAVTLYYCKI